MFRAICWATNLFRTTRRDEVETIESCATQETGFASLPLQLLHTPRIIIRMTTTVYLLTGDIGGTNSRMSLYDVKSGATPKVVKYYRNAQHLPEATLSDPDAFAMRIVVPFLQFCWNNGDDQPEQKQHKNAKSKKPSSLAPLTSSAIVACIATAGVVTNNRANLTNLGNLLIDGNAMQNNTTNKYLKQVQRAVVINDFVAQGE